MTDAVTGQSRGDGFVRFAEEGDQQPALAEMQGVYCGNHLCAPRPRLRRLGSFLPSPDPQSPLGIILLSFFY